MQKIYSTLISDIDFPSLVNDCIIVNQNVNETLFNAPQNYKINEQTPFSTRVADFYNIFSYASINVNSLFFKIKDAFYSSSPNLSKRYYIQGWVNVYDNGKSLDWHRHWGGSDSYHGFFCVNSNISYTEYKFDDGEQVKIDSVNGLLVFTKSNNNLHRTSEFNDIQPRITIAFDIHPHDNIQKMIHHWIPL
jgi:hypothetical protein